VLLGIFGLPGGAEWLIILAVVVLLFVPSLALFWFGYVLGRRRGAEPVPAAPVVPAAPGVPPVAIAPEDTAEQDGGDDA
jgi:hypothetical protein